MNSRSTVPRVADRMLLWLACLVTMCAGGYFGFYQLGGAVDAQRERTGRIATALRADAAVIASQPQLERTDAELDAQLQALDLRADPPLTVARFVRECSRIAILHHTRVVQIDGRNDATGERAALLGALSSAAGRAPFESIPLEVTLTGSYREVIGTLRGLIQAPLAARIEISAIDRDAGDDGTRAGALTAHLSIALARETAFPAVSPSAPLHAPEETDHVRSD